MGNSKIEWTEKTWNPVTGCTKISPGCQNCYAERMAKRLAGRCGYPKDEPFRVTVHEDKFSQPFRWRKPSMVFVCSMGDLFHDDVPWETIRTIMEIVIRCPQHIFQILTKRPERMRQFFKELELVPFNQTAVDAYECLWYKKLPLPNVWLGVTAENQEQADKRIPVLLQIPAAVRFVSVEPMLGPITFRWRLWEPWKIEPGAVNNHLDGLRRLDLVICGCESGPHRRPIEIDCIRNLRDQCVEANVSFFLKQMEVNGQLVKMPKLDGRVWAQFPEVSRD